MRVFAGFTLLVLALVVIGSGCIPSAPSSPPETAPAAPASPAPQHAAAEPSSPAPPAVPAPAPAPAQPSGPAGTSNVRVPLVPEKIQEGAIQMPVVSLVPAANGKGYAVAAKFPVEGLSMQGTLVPQAPGKWVLTGQFTSTIEAFSPGPPSIQVLGTMVPKEGGGLEFQGNAGEVMILFPAPMPPADAPRLAEARTLPFNLAFAAPDNAAFQIMLMPF